MWVTGTGSDVVRLIAALVIGGMITSTIHIMLVTPMIFGLVGKHRNYSADTKNEFKILDKHLIFFILKQN